jgi:N-acetylneuraminic acid mutarotase
MRSVFALLFCLLSIGGQAQYWIQKTSFAGVGRHRAVGCATENKGYLGLGHVNGTGVNYSYQDWWEYDPSSDSWSQRANYPVANYGATSFVVNGHPCVGGGAALDGQFYQFNPLENTWTAIAPCPFFNPGDTQGFSVNNKGYVYVAQQMAAYDPSSNSWSLTANPPVTFGSWTCAFTIEGSGYVKAGTKLYEYKPIHNTWTQRADFPGASTGGSSGFSILQRGFVTCGYVGGLATVTSQVWSFFPGTNSWQLELEFPGISRRFPVAFAVHNRGYFGTGTNGINMNDFWQYNPTLNTSGLPENSDVQCRIFPNPTNDFLQVELPSEYESGLIGEVRNLNGQVIQQVELLPGITLIDLSQVSSGTYFLSIPYGDKVLNKMFKIW